MKKKNVPSKIPHMKSPSIFKSKKALVLTVVTLVMFSLLYFIVEGNILDVHDGIIGFISSPLIMGGAFIVLLISMSVGWKTFFTVLTINNLLNYYSLIYFNHLMLAGYYGPGEMNFAVDEAGIFMALLFFAVIDFISLLIYLIKRKPTSISRIISIMLLVLVIVFIFYLFSNPNLFATPPGSY